MKSAALGGLSAMDLGVLAGGLFSIGCGEERRGRWGRRLW